MKGLAGNDKRRRWRLALALVAGSLSTVTPRRVPAEARRHTELRIATLMPAGTSWMKEFQRFARGLARRSGGSVIVRFYPGAVMGDERDVIAKVRRGRLQGGVLTGAGLGQVLPEVRVLELPFIFRSADEFAAVRQKLRGRFERGFAERGFVLIAWGDQGWVRAFSTGPVTTLTRLRQLKAWSWGDDPLAAAMLRAFGVPTVPLAVQGVLPALQSQIIDTVYGSAYVTLALQWHTQLNSYSTTRFLYANGGVLLARATFDTLTPHQRAALLAEGRLLEKRHRQLARGDNQAALQQLRRIGLRPFAPDAKLLGHLDARARQLWRALVGKLYPRALLDETLRLRDQVRGSQ